MAFGFVLELPVVPSDAPELEEVEELDGSVLWFFVAGIASFAPDESEPLSFLADGFASSASAGTERARAAARAVKNLDMITPIELVEPGLGWPKAPTLYVPGSSASVP